MMRLPLTPEIYNGGLPTGGTTGQVLAKNSGTDFDVGWVSGGGGGITALTGDVTASGTGSVASTITAGAVTVSKMANLAAGTILGNNTGGSAAPIALSVAQVKTLLAIAAGDVSGLATVATSGSAADLSTGTLPAGRMPAHTGDVTSSAGSVALTIANGAVTLAKQANMATASLVYRKTAGSGAPEVQTLATLKTDLGLTGTNTGDQTITLTGDVTGSGTGSFAATIANDAVSNAKLANVATGTIKGRATAGTGDPEDLTGTQATALLDAFTISDKGLAPASGGGTANFLRADGTWAAPAGGSPGAGPDRFYAFNDFFSTAASRDFAAGITSGTGAAFGIVAPQDGGAGWTSINLGTVATGRCAFFLASSVTMRLGLGEASFAARVRFSQLSNGTDRWTFRAGFTDNNNGEAVDGAFFRYVDSVNGGRFEAVTRSNNTETATDTGVTVATGTTYKLQVDVNSAGTEAVFRINGSVVATNTTNIPTGANRETGAGLLALRSAGTASLAAMTWDYILVQQLFSGR